MSSLIVLSHAVKHHNGALGVYSRLSNAVPLLAVRRRGRALPASPEIPQDLPHGLVGRRLEVVIVRADG